MRTSSKQCVAFWTLVGIGVLILYGMFALFAHVAHAEPVVAGDWHPADAAGLGASITAWLLGALLVLKVIEMALAYIAPRTPTKLDDGAYNVVHQMRERIEEIAGHVRPPAPPPNPEPGTLPAIVASGTIDGAK